MPTSMVTKSRTGCYNCKLRRIKCQEGNSAVPCRRWATITINTSAVQAPTEVSSDEHAVETTAYGMNPEYSATMGDGRPSHGYLSVSARWSSMLNRSDQTRPTSMENGGSEMTSGVVTDPGTGSLDLGPDNPFAYTVGQLNKMSIPKSFTCYWTIADLSGSSPVFTTCHRLIDETSISKSASFGGPSGRLYLDRVEEGPAPIVHLDPPQHSYARRGNTSANSETPDEDWTKITDLAERRRIQNRIAQRNYRTKLKRRLEELERRAVKVGGCVSAEDAKYGSNHSGNPHGDTPSSPGLPPPIKVEINGLIDKAFFLADNEWTGYRRNYFSCVPSYSMSSPGHPNTTTQFPSSSPLFLGTTLHRIFPSSPARPRRQRPLSPFLTPLLILLAASPVSAQHPALLHIAAGTSFATSATIPPLRGSSTVPAPWWIAMYATWAAAFAVFLMLELRRVPDWAQQRLLLGLFIFSGLNLTGSLVQGEDSMLEGVANWGPLAMTVSLWLVPALIEFWGVRGAVEMAGV